MEHENNKEIIGLGNNIEKLIIQKSKPLLCVGRLNLNINEYKILDAYLARINSKDENKRTVIFDRGDIEKILNVKNIKAKDLNKYLDKLMNQLDISTNMLFDEEIIDGIEKINIFEHIKADLGKKGWRIELTCTNTAMKYIFNIEEITYIRYKLRCIRVLKSKYSYFLFLYIENNRFRKKWTEKVEILKLILNCTEPTYEEFKKFHSLVLKKAANELNEKTECKFSYKTIKENRMIVAIQFTMEDLKLQNSEEIKSLKDSEDDEKNKYYDLIKELAKKEYNYELNDDDIKVILKKFNDAEKINKIKNKTAYIKIIIKNFKEDKVLEKTFSALNKKDITLGDIKKYYTGIRNINYNEEKKRKKEMYALSKRLQDIYEEKKNLTVVGKNFKEIEYIKLKRNELIEEEKDILLKLGKPANYLNKIYSCENCKDEGYLDNGNPCECQKYAKIEIEKNKK